MASFYPYLYSFFFIISLSLAPSLSIAKDKGGSGGGGGNNGTVSIVELQPLSFGVLEIPNRNVRLTVEPEGGAPKGSATIINDTTSRGIYQVTVSGSDTVSFDIVNVTTGSSSLQLRDIKAVYGTKKLNSFPREEVDAPNGSAPLYLGGTLDINPGVNDQTYLMTFDLIVTVP